MTLDQCLEQLCKDFDIVGRINLNDLEALPAHKQSAWINQQVTDLWRSKFGNQQRIIVVLGDHHPISTAKDWLQELQQQLNAVDISNYFVTLVVPDFKGIKEILTWLATKFSLDPVPVNVITYETTQDEPYNYNSSRPIKIRLENLLDKEKYLLTESKTFCMYPWIHIHAYPTGDAYPCCMANMNSRIGNTRENSLQEIWNSDGMRQLRVNMLSDQHSPACQRCYEKEQAGFFSGRLSANKHHGHHIDKVSKTAEDGTLNQFEMIYWDIRFSNLCNLSCRSCGHIFSSSWYQDQTKLAGPEWKLNNSVLNYAGRTETDMWEQLIPHLDYVEQIYFAGGEPLLMEEHYNILEELERRGRFDVRLIYNTNFTHVKLKDRWVFDYWKKFKNVAVGASLDAMGARAEYIRKGTDWDIVEQNRIKMLETCPNVDFYISPTVSILNALHVTDFHRDWVERGLLQPQDLNVNILQDPDYYRIDIATPEYKQLIKQKFENHLAWLRPHDPLRRATVGFESAINFLTITDNSKLLYKFWQKTQELDAIRGESILTVIPELKELQV